MTNEDEIIPLQTNNLITSNSSLIRQGLELIPGPIKRKVHVIIGDVEGGGIAEIMSTYIKNKFENKYNLKVSIYFYGEELLELADREIIDVFIPILNNLAWKDDPQADRIEANLQLITHIKEKYRKPVIVLCGNCIISEAVRAFKNGCDDFFTFPFHQEAFLKAIEKCLEVFSC